MPKLLPMILTLMFLLSCARAKLGDTDRKSSNLSTDLNIPIDGATSGKDASSAGSGDNTSTPTTITVPVEEVILTPASLPVVVSGASLTCLQTATNLELTCETKLDGILTDLGPTGMYIVIGEDSKWNPMSYTSPSTGVYTGQLPAGLANTYAVFLKYEGSQYLSSFVGQGPLPYTSVVEDGSFELIGVERPLVPSRFYTQEEIKDFKSSWSVQTPDGQTTCADSDPMFEVMVPDTILGRLGVNGNQWVDLDTHCENDPNQSANVELTQKLKVTSGHLYYVSYAARRTVLNEATESSKAYMQ